MLRSTTIGQKMLALNPGFMKKVVVLPFASQAAGSFAQVNGKYPIFVNPLPLSSPALSTQTAHEVFHAFQRDTAPAAQYSLFLKLLVFVLTASVVGCARLPAPPTATVPIDQPGASTSPSAPSVSSQPLHIPLSCIRQAFPAQDIAGAAFSPDSNRLAVLAPALADAHDLNDFKVFTFASNQLKLDVNVDSTSVFPEYKEVTSGWTITESLNAVRSMQWTPDGKSLIYLLSNIRSLQGRSHIAQLNLDSQEHAILRLCPKCYESMLGVSGVLYAVVLAREGDDSRSAVLNLVQFDDQGDAHTLVEGVDWSPLSLSHDETHLMFTGIDEHGQAASMLLDLRTNQFHRIARWTAMSLSWLDANTLLLPDETRFALWRYDVIHNTRELYAEIDTIDEKLAVGLGSAMISPDQKHLLFTSDYGGHAYLADLDCARAATPKP